MLFQKRAQQEEGVAVFSADVLAVHEDARVRLQGVSHAEHHRLEKSAALRVEARPRLELRHRRGGPVPDARIERLRPPASRLARKDAGPGALGLGPRRVDHRARLFFDERVGLAAKSVEVAGREEAFGFEPRGVGGDRLAAGPEGVQLLIRVAALRGFRVAPGNSRLLAEVEHVVVMRVAAHAHAHELDQRGSASLPGALGRPCERRGNRLGVGSVDRDSGDAVSGGLVGKHPHGGLIGDRGRERRLIVLNAEDGRQPPGGAQVDRFMPLAERRAALADEGDGDAAGAVARERHRETGGRQRGDGEGSGGRQDAPREVADVQVLALHGRSGLAHLRREDEAHGLGIGPHREFGPEVSNERRDDVAAPGSVRGAKARSAP